MAIPKIIHQLWIGNKPAPIKLFLIYTLDRRRVCKTRLYIQMSRKNRRYRRNKWKG